MSRGVIDGTTGHPIAIYDFGVSRVANSHFLGKIGTVTLGIFMNKAKFESLPPQAKAAIEKNRGEVLSRAVRQDVGRPQCRTDRGMEKDPKRTVTELTAEQTAQWDKMLCAGRFTAWEGKDARNKTLSRGHAQGACRRRAPATERDSGQERHDPLPARCTI